MCGLVGLISLAGENKEDIETRVRTMCEQQRHRGPDDLGVVLNDNVCLGSVRLSIIDLTSAGHMPMSDASEKWWIAYNGEVYNFSELRTELIELGHSFLSETDTEVVLHAFMEWGEACLEKFIGMFAFAIHDRVSGQVHLVRDRYGIKPLYYMKSGKSILFSSEIKTLVQNNQSLKLDKQCMLEWALYRNVDILTPETMLEGICSVLPGEIVSIQGGKACRRQHYSQREYVCRKEFDRFSEATPGDVVSEIRSALNEAVRQRLVSDVPVGTLCSGGLDSSLVTAIAAEHSRDLTVFNVAIENDRDLDESIFARQIADHFGLRFVSLPLTGEIFRRELPKVVQQCDFPLTHPNSVAYHLICQVARQHGVIVLLSGEGADELFGGYDRYRKNWKLLKIRQYLERLPESLRHRMAVLGLASMGLPTSGHARELLPFAAKLAGGFAREDWQMACQDTYDFVEDPIERALLGDMLADLSDFLTPLLRRLDRTSMANSTECRVPFLDHRVVHKAINLPLSYKVGKRSGKWVIRKIAEDYLPNDLWKRRKVGFPLPLKNYLSPLVDLSVFRGGFCEEHIGLRGAGMERFLADWERNTQGFFSMLSLEIWGRMFIRGETLESVSELLDAVTRGK